MKHEILIKEYHSFCLVCIHDGHYQGRAGTRKQVKHPDESALSVHCELVTGRVGFGLSSFQGKSYSLRPKRLAKEGIFWILFWHNLVTSSTKGQIDLSYPVDSL